MQRIIRGKHVVKVPVTSTSAMFFIKDGPNGVINAYSYRWLDKTKKGEDFSGKVQQFNFQDFTLHQKTYIDGKISNPLKFVFKNAPTLDQINALKNELKNQKNPTSSRKMVTNSLSSFLETVKNVIGNTLGAIGCTLISGEWGSCGGDLTDNNCGSFSASCSLDGGSQTDMMSIVLADADYAAQVNLNINNTGGSSSGGSSSGGSSSGGSSSGGSSSGGSSYSPFSNLSSSFWSAFNTMGGGGYSSLSWDLNSNVRPCIASILNNIKAFANVGANIGITFGVPGDQSSMDVMAIINNVANTPNHRLNFIEEDLGVDDNNNIIDADSQMPQIRLNPTYLGTATDLSVARTIIHEMVHTYFLWELQAGTFAPNTPEYIEFQNENSILFTKNANAVDNNTQHMQMADKYVTGIATMLYGYTMRQDFVSPVPGESLEDYCKDLAWGGLQGTAIYKALPATQRDRIEKAIIAEVNDPNTIHHNPTTIINCH